MVIKEKEIMDDADRVHAGYVLFRAIIEVLGKPPEHIEATLKGYVKKIEDDPEITVLKKDFSKPAEQEGGFYSTFVELEAWSKNMPKLFWFCFDYMPSSVEILDPTTLTFSSNDFSDFLNDLQARLHQIDMVVKTARQQTKQLTKNANLVVQNAIMSLTVLKPRNFDFLQKATGVPKEQLQTFLDGLVKLGKLTVEDGYYKPVLRKGE